jgi:hypothetical protein
MKKWFIGIGLSAALVACPAPEKIPKISVSPKAQILQSGATPIALTATLENTSGLITWTLEPSTESGSLSTNSGTSVNYTPPASVTTSKEIIVKATVGGVFDTATITVNPKPLPTVQQPTGTPISITDLNNLPTTIQNNATNGYNNLRNDVNSFINNFSIPNIGLNPLSQNNLEALLKNAPTDMLQLMSALGVPTSQGIRLQAATENYTLLPKGLLDCTSGTCPNTPTGTSEDLIIKWKSGTKQGEVLIDWNGNTDGTASEPVKAFSAEYSPSAGNTTRYYAQVPTKARATITFDGVVVLNAKADFTFLPKLDEPNVVILNPACTGSYYCTSFPFNYESAKISVAVRNTTGTDFAILNYDLNTVATGGPALVMNAEVFGNTVRRTAINAKLGGSITKDSLGYWTDFAFTGDSTFKGSVQLGTNLTALDVTANSIVRGANNQPTEVSIPSGSFSHDNKFVTFTGKIDDSNANCIAGENLNITTNSGTTTLEAYLISNGTVVCQTYLQVTKTGSGNGTVSSNPTGLFCGTGNNNCNASFNQSSVVTLTATPMAGSSFTGWNGACAGTSTTCVVTLNTEKTITAQFDQIIVSPILGNTPDINGTVVN